MAPPPPSGRGRRQIVYTGGRHTVLGFIGGENGASRSRGPAPTHSTVSPH